MRHSMFTLALISVVLCHAFASNLRICHTNDFHAKYLEVGDSNVKCQWWDSVADKCYSGIARLSTAFQSLNCDIKVQAGDWVQGSLLDTVFKQTIAIEAYRWIKYDFAVFGNHEFDYGNGLINDTIRQIAPFTTWISTNVFFKGQGMDDLPLYRYVDRHDICWVSTLTTETMVLSAVEDNVSMKNENEWMRKYIAKCAQQKNVVAITHQGYSNDLETCRDVKEIDLIIGGHSHTNLDNGEYPVKVTREDGSVCWVTQAFAHGRYIGVLDIKFNDDGEIYLDAHSYYPIDYRVKRDAHVLLKVQMFNYQVVQKASEVVGTVTDDIAGGQLCRGPETVPGDGTVVNGGCSMGHLVCDSLLELGKAHPDSKKRPLVCLMNGGTLRNSFSKGKVTLRDLVNVLPFGNTITTAVMKGSDVIAALEHGLSLFGSDNRGGFPGGLGNMVVTTKVDGSKPLAESVSIESVLIGDEALEEDAEYVMVTNSYAAGGGDGYSWGDAEFYDWGVMLREATQKYLGIHDPYSPVEGRLLMTGSNTGELNKDAATAFAADSGDASRLVYNEGSHESELDASLVTQAQVSVDGKCSSGTCV